MFRGERGGGGGGGELDLKVYGWARSNVEMWRLIIEFF